MAEQNLFNDIALVTGGAGGIGQEVCKLLRKHGAKVVVADLSLNAAKETLNLLKGDPSYHLAAKVDVSNQGSIEQLSEAISHHFNGNVPSVVVNCAGIGIPSLGLDDVTEEAWDKTMNVNLKGTFLINKQFLKLMVEKWVTRGSVINISSLAANGFSAAPHYATSKAGVDCFTKSVAMEFGAKGIRVNAVAPGFVDTPLVQKEVAEEVIRASNERNGLRRIGRPEEIAELCLFLASDKSSYINGEVIRITGGR